ncbi:hypothetical protein AbraIFM66951_003624 [Aspergillus brasiliensis]|uniref:Uncharacterized protein n=1 Tax=Aspergillus brasiliensis TaxID=319629 RepID=A0A9W6DTH2_9EURO|nr:hypothetical protein AbraCBS73388_002569 [Aspergillus brasiliensis]GKZ50487.1 hypothetical protein AbraIFM66951_003624 [Aspergillus brasiliensis]
MTSYTDREHKAYAVLDLLNTLNGSVISSDLGTEANPIVIGDDLAPLGSAFNPIAIHVDENWCYNEIYRLTSYTDPTHALSIATEGTRFNTIYTADGSSSSGSGSSPAVIHKDWLGSDADT